MLSSELRTSGDLVTGEEEQMSEGPRVLRVVWGGKGMNSYPLGKRAVVFDL